MARILIIGYGNPLRSDDGFGCHAAEALAKHFRRSPGIEVMACHQLTPDLADDLSCAELAVFIDASRTLEPGTVKMEEIGGQSAIQDAGVSPYSHHVSPAALLQFCQNLWGRSPRAFLCTAGTADCGQGEALSPALQRALDAAVSQVAALV